MIRYELAQLNIAQLLAPIDSPQLQDFVANLERINQLAEQSPGFIWRLQDEAGDATSFTHFGAETIANMSVWRDRDALFEFVYRTAHVHILRHKRKWFEPLDRQHMALWWVPEGHQPTLQEADQRLQLLQTLGPTADAFTFKAHFPAPTTALSCTP